MLFINTTHINIDFPAEVDYFLSKKFHCWLVAGEKLIQFLSLLVILILFNNNKKKEKFFRFFDE